MCAPSPTLLRFELLSLAGTQSGCRDAHLIVPGATASYLNLQTRNLQSQEVTCTRMNGPKRATSGPRTRVPQQKHCHFVRRYSKIARTIDHKSQ